jgi:hypothetical protein
MDNVWTLSLQIVWVIACEREWMMRAKQFLVFVNIKDSGWTVKVLLTDCCWHIYEEASQIE